MISPLFFLSLFLILSPLTLSTMTSNRNRFVMEFSSPQVMKSFQEITPAGMKDEFALHVINLWTANYPNQLKKLQAENETLKSQLEAFSPSAEVRVPSSTASVTVLGRRKQSTMKVMSALEAIHGKGSKNIAIGLSQYLLEKRQTFNALINRLRSTTSFLRMETYDLCPNDSISLEKSLEMIDESGSSLNVSGFRRLRKVLPRRIPSAYAISEGRKVAEKVAEMVTQMVSLADGSGYYFRPGPLLDYLTKEPFISPVIATLDGNNILKRQSLLAAVRVIRPTPLTRLLQSPQHVYPIFRSWGTDDDVGMVKLMQPFQEIVEWTQRTQIPGRFLKNQKSKINNQSKINQSINQFNQQFATPWT